LKERYRARGGDSADIKVGLEYAEANEWLGYDGAKQAWYLWVTSTSEMRLSGRDPAPARDRSPSKLKTRARGAVRTPSKRERFL
jgi:hypothetical protein